MEGSQAHNSNTLNISKDSHFSHVHHKDQILGDLL